MWLFLKKTPDYEPRAWDNSTDLPPWLERSPGLVIATHPDVSDDNCENRLIEIAKSIPPADVSTRRRRAAGRIMTEDVPDAVTVQVKPHMIALRQMLKDAKVANTPVSARGWRAEHATELDLDDALWLELALDVLAKGTRITKGVEVGYDELSREEPFAGGNVFIKDLRLWKNV